MLRDICYDRLANLGSFICEILSKGKILSVRHDPACQDLGHNRLLSRKSCWHTVFLHSTVHPGCTVTAALQPSVSRAQKLLERHRYQVLDFFQYWGLLPACARRSHYFKDCSACFSLADHLFHRILSLKKVFTVQIPPFAMAASSLSCFKVQSFSDVKLALLKKHTRGPNFLIPQISSQCAFLVL